MAPFLSKRKSVSAAEALTDPVTDPHTNTQPDPRNDPRSDPRTNTQPDPRTDPGTDPWTSSPRLSAALYGSPRLAAALYSSPQLVRAPYSSPLLFAALYGSQGSARLSTALICLTEIPKFLFGQYHWKKTCIYSICLPDDGGGANRGVFSLQE